VQAALCLRPRRRGREPRLTKRGAASATGLLKVDRGEFQCVGLRERGPCDSEVLNRGSYHIFGHGGCLGDPGHCEVKPRREYDPRPAHPLTPAKKVVVATEAGKRVIEQDAAVTVTVVPIIEPLPYENVDPKYTEDPVDIGYVRIVTYG
jgi:hypothetical protein